MPLVLKDQPPVAGAIMWCRSLFQRIKGTVLRFQTMKDLFDSEKGKEVSSHTNTHTSANSHPSWRYIYTT